MKKLKDFIIIVCMNIILFSVFSIVAEQENKLFLEASNKYITEYTDFTKENN